MADTGFEKLTIWDHLFRDFKELEYMKAVEEAAGPENKIFFLDPDKYENALKAVGIDYKELDSPDTLKKRINNLTPEETEIFRKEVQKTFSIQGSPEEIKNITDGAINSLTAGAAIVGDSDKNIFVATLPGDFIDNVDEYIKQALGSTFDEETLSNIIKNYPGDDIDLAIAHGYHEGGHAHKYYSPSTRLLSQKASEIKDEDSYGIKKLKTSITLENEVGADRIEKEGLIKDGHPDLGLASKDLRALSLAKSHPNHLTSALLNSNDPTTPLHIDVAKDLLELPGDGSDTIGRLIYGSRPKDQAEYEKWKNDIDKGKYELLKNDPESFFKALNKGLEREIEEITEKHEASPDSMFWKKHLVKAQIMSDYSHDFEAAYRRRALGQKDFPDYERTRLLPEDEIQEVFAESKKNTLLSAFREIRIHNAETRFSSELDELRNLEKLKQSDPQAYFEKQTELFEQIKENAIAQYETGSSREDLKNLVEAQYFVAHYSGEYNAELCIHNKQNDPDLDIKPLPPKFFVAEEQLHEYYECIERDMRLNDTSYNGILNDVDLTQNLEESVKNVAYDIISETSGILFSNFDKFMKKAEAKEELDATSPKKSSDTEIKTNATDMGATHQSTDTNAPAASQFNNKTGTSTPEAETAPKIPVPQIIADNTTAPLLPNIT